MKYEINFASIELIAKSLEVPTVQLTREDINFNFFVDVKVAELQKLAVAITDITIQRISDNTRMAFFKTLVAFEFPEFEKIFTKLEENKYDIPVDLEILLKSTGLSTTRGIIFSELRGTYLQNAVMPLIDIASIILEARSKGENQSEQINMGEALKNAK